MSTMAAMPEDSSGPLTFEAGYPSALWVVVEETQRLVSAFLLLWQQDSTTADEWRRWNLDEEEGSKCFPWCYASYR